MPFCHVRKRNSNSTAPDGSEMAVSGAEGIASIFYQRYGHGPIKVLFIIGLAGTHESWGPQVVGLSGTDIPHEAENTNNRNKGGDDAFESHTSHEQTIGCDNREQTGSEIEVCTFDNRGVGKSSIPKVRSEYSTKIMAEDALALLDHLGWDKAHICGHSMGGMIASKLAAIAPHRLSSLTLIGVTGGGYQILPKLNRTSLSIAYRIFRAKTPEERSAVDLDTHYTHDYLESVVGETKRRALLFRDYVKNLSTTGMQPRYGLEGQVYACWNHRLTSDELATIRSAGVIVAFIHGRRDIIAQVEHARKLAKKLHPVSRMVELSGGHLVTHQNTDEVNGLLRDMIRAVKMNVHCTGSKENDFGIYTSEASGAHSQKEETSLGLLEAQNLADRHSPEAASAVLTYFRNLVPEWVEMLYIYPTFHWTASLFSTPNWWKLVCLG